ncbi:MAG: HD domain-containing protein [Thermogutta sp.]
MQITPRFDDALQFAVTLHRHQRRKVNDAPYIGHLLRVCGIVMEYGGTEDEAIAALLHDALEDQNRLGLAEEILRRFGPTVLAIVRACSDTEVEPKPAWRERKENFLRQLHTANAAVRLVQAADKLDNVSMLLGQYRVFGPEIWKKFSGGREGTLWYYRRVVEILRSASENPLILELAKRVEELKDLA